MLKRVSGFRQPVAHNIGQLRLAKCAARLLVIEDLLQFDHLARQRGNFLLRLVNQRQTLAQIAQRARGALAGIFQIIGHGFGNLGQLLGHGAGQFAARGFLRGGHAVQPTRQLRLRAGHLFHGFGDFLHHWIGRGFWVVRIARAQAQGQHRSAQTENCADQQSQKQSIFKHGPSVADSCARLTGAAAGLISKS